MAPVRHRSEGATVSSPPTTRAVVPPVSRTGIHRLLDRSVARPLTTVTAARGYGKTTMLTSWAHDRRAAWLTLDQRDRDPWTFAGRLVDVLSGDAAPPPRSPTAEVGDLVDAVVAAAVDPPSLVVVDEADQLAGSPALELLRRVVAVKGSRVRAVVSSRVDLGLVDDAVRARGGAVELEAEDLAFDAQQTAPLLADTGAGRLALAHRIVDVTGGWPAVVHGLAEVVRGSADGTDLPDPGDLVGRDGPLSTLLADLLDEEDGPTRHTLAELALLSSTGPEELARIRGIAPRTANDLVRDLVRRGLARPLPGRPSYVAADHVELPALVRRAVLDDLVAREHEEGVVAEVVEGLTATGDLPRALRALTGIGASGAVARLLEEHGASLLDAGHTDVIAQAAGIVRGSDRTMDVERCHGDALAAAGDLGGALERFEAGLERAGDGGTGSLELVARLGRIHETRGELRQAIERFRTFGIDVDGAAAADPAAVEVLASWAAVHGLRGEVEEARTVAARGVELADRQGGSREQALAARVLAMLAVSDADHAAYEQHHRRAFSAADRSGDHELVARVRVDRAAHHLSEGRTTEALFEVDRALGLDGVPRSAAVRAFARCERAEVLLRTGRLDEATREARTARRMLDALGSRRVGAALHLLGDIARERGELDRAAGFYDDSLAVAAPDGEQRSCLAATIGSARVLTSFDPAAARRTAGSALALPAAAGCAGAHLAAAWAALAEGDTAATADHVAEAEVVARRRRDERGGAEAATLSALLAPDPLPGLRDAVRRWHRLHDPLWAARTELAVARRSRRPDERSRAGDLEQRLARLGSPLSGGEFAHRTLVAAATSGVAQVRILGGWQVRVGDRDVTATLDEHPVARAVLQALAVAGGMSLAREDLARVAFPDDPADPMDPRLSDAIATLPSLLRADASAPSPTSGNGTAVRLRPEGVDIDVTAFERLADRGLRAVQDGHAREAVALLRAADERYTGDLLEGRPDTRWADRRRSAVRARADAVARALSDMDPGPGTASR